MGKDKAKKRRKLSSDVEGENLQHEAEDNKTTEVETIDNSKVDADSDNMSDTGENDVDNDADEGDLDELNETDDVCTLPVSDGKYRNKQRCLTLCSRGVTARYRHLLEDLRTLIPHHKKESKLDSGDENLGNAIKQVAEIRGCNTVLFLECRKRQDAYFWLGRVGGRSPGPSAKFHVTNIHTMDELRLTGNCMKHSRPILSFDESFNRLGHLKLLKELFVDVFGTPRGHPKSKPFIDRVMSFYYADNRIWVRHYQILEEKPETALEAQKLKKQLGAAESTSLVEIGPRFVLEPIRIFRGSFGGQTLYQNPSFVSPNEIRAAEKRKQGMTFENRKASHQMRKDHEASIVVPPNPLDSVFK